MNQNMANSYYLKVWRSLVAYGSDNNYLDDFRLFVNQLDCGLRFLTDPYAPLQSCHL